MSKMNSTSLYVSTNNIILKSEPGDPSSWQDLYRLLPYLRNSLCCVVCGNLLINPFSPNPTKCQHHLCEKCQGGKKKIKPACVWCKQCDEYKENGSLRTLLQCYNKMCIYLLKSYIYKNLLIAEKSASTGVERGAGNLISLIKEGALFRDNYQSNCGLTKDDYSILPCVYTNSSTQTLQNCHQITTVDNKNILNTNGTPLYSVMYAGTGNKITIKRKPKEQSERAVKKDNSEKAIFKKPPSKCTTVKPKRGCRCGNATATPGKLTCCGQRCPCYVVSKACVECKCRGCRNPHTIDGNKVLGIPPRVVTQYQDPVQSITTLATHQQPQQPQQHLQIQPLNQQDMSLLQHVKIELDANLTIEQLNEHLNLKVFESFADVPQTLPHTFLMNSKREDDEDDLSVDV